MVTRLLVCRVILIFVVRTRLDGERRTLYIFQSDNCRHVIILQRQVSYSGSPTQHLFVQGKLCLICCFAATTPTVNMMVLHLG